MARTADGATLTRRHRAAQLAIRAETLRDLTSLWRTVDPTDLSSTIDRFAVAGAVLVRSRFTDSATLGRQYFRDFRIAERIGRMDLPDLLEAPARGSAAGLLRGAGLSGIINARRSGFSPQAAAQQGLVKATGSASRLVLEGGRGQVMTSIERDRQAVGWVRITSGDPCSFCALIASRGAVFTEDSVDFESHDHCACEPEPYYEGSEIPEANRRFDEEYTRAVRDAEESGELERGTSNDRLNAFRRARS